MVVWKCCNFCPSLDATAQHAHAAACCSNISFVIVQYLSLTDKKRVPFMWNIQLQMPRSSEDWKSDFNLLHSMKRRTVVSLFSLKRDQAGWVNLLLSWRNHCCPAKHVAVDCMFIPRRNGAQILWLCPNTDLCCWRLHHEVLATMCWGCSRVGTVAIHLPPEC